MLARNRTVLSRVTNFQRDHTICEQREFQVTRVTVACSQPPLRHPRVQNDATLDQHVLALRVLRLLRLCVLAV
jgi:hypothetical protein